MEIESLLSHYGYLVIFAGTFLEGETVLVLGGLTAQRGYLDLPFVIISAFAGTLLGDQFFFLLGRRRGSEFISRRPSWSKRIEKANQLLDRYQWPVLLRFRFLYGLRSVIPFTIGLTRIHFRRFFILNMMGAAVWAFLIGIAGFLFGHALESVIGEIKRYELAIMFAIAIAGFLIWIIHFRLRKRKTRKS